MSRYVNKLRELLEKEDKSLVDFDECLSLLENIEDDIDSMQCDLDDYSDEIYDLEKKVEDLEDELEKLIPKKKDSKSLDSVFKEQIFEELSKRYTYYKLEELLKNNGII